MNGEKNYCSLGLKVGDIEIIAEGDKQFVKNSFWKLYKKTGLLSKNKSIAKATVSETGGNIKEYEKMSLGEFVHEKNPRGNSETCVVCGFYIQKLQKRDNFSNGEIKDCYKEMGLTRPSNLAQDLKAAVQKTRIRSLGRGRWTITQTGEKFVSDELPRQDSK